MKSKLIRNILTCFIAALFKISLCSCDENYNDSIVEENYDNEGAEDENIEGELKIHLDYVINSFNVGEVYFPKQTATTKCFENFFNAFNKKNLKLNAPVPGNQFNLGQATFTILSPKKEQYKNINDSSIVLKVTFCSTSFIFTGDAGKEAEDETLLSGIDLKAETAPEERMVYWTDKGKCCHYDRNCDSLKKSKNVRSGKISECPKKDACKWGVK